MTKIPVLTERDLEAMKTDWNVFIERTKETPYLFTIEQWGKILAANIISRTTHLERVTQIIEAKPYIGIVADTGLVAIYLGTNTSLVKNVNGVTWITKCTLGTYENADNTEIEGVTVSRMGTTNTFKTTELKIFQKFFSLTTDDLRNVPMLSFDHTWLDTEAYYLYSCGTTTVTPLPEGVENLRDFRFITTSGHTNTIEAIDENNRSHVGVLRLTTDKKPNIEVIYEAITNPGTPSDRTVL
jgi:hypothetical protein